MRYDATRGALEHSPRLCRRCAAPAAQHCAQCKLVSYCSRDCQRVDWATDHAHTCGSIVSPGRLRIPSDAMHEAMAIGAPMPVDVPTGTVFVARGAHVAFGSRAAYETAYADLAFRDGWLRTLPQAATIVSPDCVFVAPEFARAVETTIEPLEAANALFVHVTNRADPPYDGLIVYVTQRIGAGEPLALGRGIVPMTMCDA